MWPSFADSLIETGEKWDVRLRRKNACDFWDDRTSAGLRDRRNFPSDLNLFDPNAVLVEGLIDIPLGSPFEAPYQDAVHETTLTTPARRCLHRHALRSAVLVPEHCDEVEFVFCGGNARRTDTHVAVTIVAIDGEIVQWLQPRERRKGRAGSRRSGLKRRKLIREFKRSRAGLATGRRKMQDDDLPRKRIRSTATL